MILLLAWALLRPAAPIVTTPLPPPRPIGATAQGQLRSAGLRQPIAGAKIFATPRRGDAWSREAITTADGSFVLTDLPTRDFLLTIVAPDHERLTQTTTAAYWTARRLPVIYLQPTGSGHYRTLVTAARDPQPSVTSTRLSPAEIATLPGSQGDPLRALQNLPGAARIPGGLGLLVMRGATPNQSQIFYGEHPIPRAFHFPGLASVIPGAALSGIQYTPGNFASAYGNAVGGVVLLAPRTGRRDGIHGMAKIDITSSGALVEGPMGRGSFLIAAQRGYLDLALQRIHQTSGILLPRSYDYQTIFEHPVGHGSITTRFLGAADSVRVGLGQTTELRAEFHRIDLSLRQRLGAISFLLAPAIRFDRNSFGRPESTAYTRRNTVGLLRAEISVQPSSRFHLTVGADTQLDLSKSLKFNNFTGTGTRNFDTRSGLYVEPVLTLNTLSFAPSVRLNSFSGDDTRSLSVDPRLTVRWSPHRRVGVGIGIGQYSQPIRHQYTVGGAGVIDSASSSLNFLRLGGSNVIFLPNAALYLDDPVNVPEGPLGVSQALHLSSNIHIDILASLGVDATLFYRRVRDGLPPIPTDLDDTGSITWGVEAMVRKQLTRRLQGWIAYTFMHSVQGTMKGDALTRRLPADFDQRHNLVVVLSLKLPRRWELGGRFRVVTGLPFTPVLGGIADANAIARYPPGSGLTNVLLGEVNSARLGTFHQLDLRVDRSWVLRRCIVGAYLDIQNIYNRQNPEGLIYNLNLTGVRTAVGLPILPVIGVRVDY